MKQLIAIIIAFQLAATVGWEYLDSNRDRSFVDQSGVVVKTNLPENTVKSFYELLAQESYDAASKLQTKESAQLLSAEVLEESFANTRVTGARLAEVYPAVNDKDLAVVGSVRSIRFPGNNYESQLFSVTLLRYESAEKRWAIISNLTEIEKDRFQGLLSLLIKADKKMLEYSAKSDKFDKEQIKSIQQQINGVLAFHQYQNDEYKKALAELKKKDDPKVKEAPAK